VSGRFAEIGRAVEAALAGRAGKPVPMNIDGATAVIYAELGFPRRWRAGCSACRARWRGRARLGADAAGRAATRARPRPHYRWTYDGPPTPQR
jgi:hypothetical protein